jgi:hypothetical protein
MLFSSLAKIYVLRTIQSIERFFSYAYTLFLAFSLYLDKTCPILRVSAVFYQIAFIRVLPAMAPWSEALSSLEDSDLLIISLKFSFHGLSYDT